MCDCFHLPFPNWHGSPGTGAGRRLKGPEPEDDSVCEDAPEFLEGERPRPQGSSPVNEYPATEKYTDLDKEGEEELYDPYQKGSGNKKGKKVGFGSFFEKRSKMSQEECPESGVIVKTPKEVCAKGLVVSGGGKEGIFIKEVKAESPAAKHLSAQEGDQILSATVYFDNVSYEDALQILEHAQPYKMEFCLKRKPLTASDLESSTAERQEIAPGEEGISQLERGRTKTQRRQDARISWPKFPSFTRGRKAHFKRSHSTSEAEEQRKLEMSPPTSDTESPMKSQELGKDKKTKKQKVKLSKMKMKGVNSKSVEEETDSIVPVSRSLENVQPQQAVHVLDAHSPPPQGSLLGETAQIYVIDQQEKKETTKIKNECHFADVSGSVAQTSQHRVDLISLDKTLKTTDISDFLADRGSSSTKKSPDVKKKKKKERSELKVNIQGKEKEDLSPEGLLKSPQTLILKTSSDSLKTPDMGARAQDLSSNTVGPNVISHPELKGYPIAIDINAERIDPNKSIPQVGKESSAEKVISTTAWMGDADISLPKVDMSLDMSDVGLLKKSPMVKSEKHKKDRSILIRDSERYGIRPRGPMADIGMTKKYLGQGSSVDSDSDISKPKSPKMKTSFPGVKGQEITANRKDASIKMETVLDIQSPPFEIQASKSPKDTNIDETEKTGTKTVPKFKMPKIEVPDFKVHDPIVMTEVKASKSEVDVKDPKVEHRMHKTEIHSTQPSTTKQVDIKIELLKREDIEIPGMEATALAGNLQTIGFKLPETGKIDASVPVVGIHAKKFQGDMKVDGIKDTTSKTDLQTFKLPKVDISSLDVHQQITKSDVTAEKVKLDLTAEVFQPKTPEMDVKGQGLKIKASDHSTGIGINDINGEMIKRSIPTYKVPKIDSPDPDAHEPITMKQVSFSKTKIEIQGSKIQQKLPMAALDDGMLEISSSHFKMDKMETPERKLPKREDIEIPGMESILTAGSIQTIDIQSPGIGKQDASATSVEIQAMQIDRPTFKLPKIDSDFDVHEQITKRDVNTEMSKSPKQHKKDQIFPDESKKGKFKIPPVPQYDASFPNLKSDVKLTEERETGEMKCISDTEIKIAARTEINADFKSPSTEMSQNKEMKVEVELGAATTDQKESEKKSKKTKVSMPTFGIAKPDIRFPDAGVQISLSKGKDEVKLAKACEIETENLSGDTSLSPVKTPMFEKQDLDIKGPIISNKEPSLHMKLPELEQTVSGKIASFDIKGPNVAVEEPAIDINVASKIIDLAGQESKSKSGISLSNVKRPRVDINISKPDNDFPHSEASVKVESPIVQVEKSSVEGKLQRADIAIKGVDLTMDDATIPVPKIGTLRAEAVVSVTKQDIKEPQVVVKGPYLKDKLDISLKETKDTLPHMDIPPLETSKPDMKELETQSGKVGVKVPGIYIKEQTIEIDKSKDKIELPELKMPDINVAPQIILKSTQTETKPFISKPLMDVKTPEVHIKPPSLEIKAGERKERQLYKEIPKAEVELSVPQLSVKESTVEGQSLDRQAEIPDIEMAKHGKFKMPHVKLPSFGFSKPEVKGDNISGDLPTVDVAVTKPDANINVPEISADVTSAGVKLPEADLAVSGKPSALDIKDYSMDVGAPEVDIDMKVKGTELEGQGSKFKLPKFGISLPKAKGPAMDITVSKPDVDISLPQVTAEAKLPGVEVEGPSVEGTVEKPEVDSKGVDMKLKTPKISLPKLGLSKPEITAPKTSGNVNLPSVDIAVTKPDADINALDISADVTSAGVKLPEADLAVSGKPPAVDIKGYSMDVEAPEVDIDMKAKGSELEGQGSKFRLPKFGISLPKAKGPAMDITVSKPDVDISLPQVTAEAKLPGVEVEGPSVEETVGKPEVDSKGVDIKLKKPKMSLPKFGFSKPEITAPKISGNVNLPSVDIAVTKPDADINVPDISADVTSVGVKLPEADLAVSGKPPAVDIKGYSMDVEGPEIDIDMKVKGTELEGQGSKFKLPKSGISLPKAKGPVMDITVSKPDVDISLPQVTAEAKLPGVEVEGPSVEGTVDIPEVDSKGVDIKLKKPKMSLPKFGFSKPEITAPKISGNVNLPSVDIAVTKPDADIHLPDISADVTSVGVKLPEADLAVSGKPPAVDIKGYSMDVEAPEVDIDMKVKGTELEGQGSKFKLPKFGISLPKAKGPAMDITVSKPDVDISLPQVTAEAKLPGVEVEGPSVDGTVDIPEVDSKGVDIKLKKPKMSLPKFGFSKPEITAPKISGNVDLPSVDIAVTKPDADINVPDISADVTSVGVKLPEADLAVSGKPPAVDIKDYSMDVEAPEVDIDMKVKGTDLEGQGSKFKLPKFGISLPKAKGPAMDITASKPDIDISLPQMTAEAKLPGVEVEGSSLDGQAKIPDIEVGAGDQGRFKMPHIKFPSFGFSKPEITAPKISGNLNLPSVDIAVTKPDADINVPDISADVTSVGVKLPEADLAVSGKPPAVDIKGYSMDVEAPEVDIDMKVKGTELEGQGSKFKLPKSGISLPKAKGPAMDITVSKPDVDISLPQVTAEAKLPGVEVEGPSVEGTVDIPEVDSKGVDIKLKKPKMSLPKFGFSKPEITAPKISGNLNLPSVDIAVTKPDADINVPDISADVTSVGVKLPEADLAVSGKPPAVDIKGYSMDVEAPEVDIDMKVKGTELEGQGSKFKLPKFGISLPKAKGPAMDITVSKPDVDISLPQVTAEAKLPGVEVEGPSVEGTVDIPEVDSKGVDIKLKKPKMSLPKFGFSKPEITAPKISGNLNLPSVDIAVTKPDADINVPDVSADVTSVGVKLPEADLAVSGKPPAVDIKGYSMDVEAPEVDIDMKVKGIELEGQGSKFKLPKFGISFPKTKGPAMDITVSKPDVDISLPQVTAEAKLPGVEVEGPSVEGTVDIPEVDSKGVDIKLKKPKMSLPKFGFSKPEITAPKISGNLNLPSVDIAVTKPDADINVPDISADVTSVGVKLPEADLAVSGKPPAVDIKGYSMDVEAPEVDIDMKVKGTELEGQGSKFKLPKFGISLPKAKGPAMDITVSKPDVDISLPQVTAEAKLPGVEVEGPSVEGTVDIPEVDSKGVDIKLKKPKMSLPKFGFSKPEITAPKISGNLNLPSVDIAVTKPDADINVPDVSADVTSVGVKLPEADLAVSGKPPAVDIKGYSMDVEAPEVDIDMKVKGTELEGQGSKFKLPKFGISFPKTKGPAMDITVSKPDVDISLPQVTAEAKLPGVEVEGPSVEGTVDIPEVDSKGVDIKLKKPKMSLPKFGFSKPEITAPKISGNLNLPSVDIAVTKPDADIHLPDISADVTSVGVKLQEADLAVSGKPPAVDIKGYSMDVEAPEVDIDMKVKGTELEGQGSKFKLPKFGISLPKAKGPAMDITVSKPDVDISLPQVTAEAKLPGVEVEGSSLDGQAKIPDIEAGAGDQGRFKIPHIKFPSFGFSKPEITAPKISGNLNLPSVDIAVTKPDADINVPDISADVTSVGVKLPEADLAVSGKPPAVDIKGYSMDVEAPEVDIDMKVKGTELEGQGSKFKLPKFGISLPKSKGPAMDITVSKPDVDISLPQVTAEAKLPGVEVEGPSVEGTVDIPELDSKGVDIKLKKPKMSLPKFGFSKPEITAPKISGNLNLPSVDIAVTKPDADINVPDISADVTSVGVKLPEADLAVSGKPPAVDIKGCSMDVEAPEVDIDMKVKGTELEGQGSKFKLPKFGISLPKAKGPAMDITVSKPDVDISLPQVTAEAKLPGVEVEGSSLDGQAKIPDIEAGAGDQGRFKMPHIKFPSFGFSKPEITAPKISGNLNLPSVDIAVTKPDADIKVPDISADVTSVGVKLPEADLAVSGKPPAVDIKGYSMDVETSEVDIDMKVKGTELEGQGSKFKLPKFGISHPKAKGPAMDITVSKPDVDISLPQVTAEAKLPGVEVEGPSVEGTVDIPEVDSKGVDIKLKKPKMSLPKFGFSKPEITAPKISGNLNLPSVDIAVTKPDADINVPDISADVTSVGVKLPEADLAVSGKPPAVDIKGYSMDVEAPEVDIDMKVKGTELEGQGSKFKLPKFGISLPKAKGPAMDITVSKPDVDISLPQVTAEAKLPGVEVEGSSLDGQAKIPDIEAGAGDQGRFKIPHIKFPSFGFSKPEITAPKISGNLNLPSVDIAVTKPDADINVPDISADVTSVGVKLPEADLAVSGKPPAVDIKGYSMDVEAPEVDIDMKVKGTELEGQGSKFKLPKFGISLPKSKGPAMDITVSKPDVDISLPQVTAEAKLPGVEVEGPSVEGTVDIPELDSKGADIKLKKPKMSLPKFGFSKPEITAPKISGNLNLPSVDIAVTKPDADINVPDISADVTSVGVKLPEADLAVSGKPPAVDIKGCSMDVEAPEVDIDMKVKGTELEGQGSKFKLPKFGISLPKAKGPAMDITVSKPDVDISLPQVTAEAKLPGVEVEGSSLDGQAKIPDIEAGAGDQGRFKMPHIKFPSFGFSKPEITAPKISGNLNLPSVDIAVTKPDADINVPDISADVTSVGVKLPEADLAVSGKPPAVDIKGYSMDVEAPEVDIDMKVKGTELEGQGSKFKLPKFGISLPKAKGPAMDITVSKPDVDISLPQVTAEAKLPGVEVEGSSLDGQAKIPDIEAGAGDQGRFKIPHIKFPSFGFSKPEITAPKISGNLNLPSVDIAVTKPDADINVPDISADVTSVGVKLPEADLAVSGKPPAVDIKGYSMDVEAPEVDIDMKVKGTELEGQGSKFKLPKFGISLPKSKGPAMDITVSKPDVDISLPQVTAEAKLPGVEVEGPSVEGTVDIPELDSKGVDIKLKKPKMSLPKFGFSKPEITAPKISGNLNLPSVDIAVTKPDADINVPDISADVTSVGVKLPEADLAVSGKPPAVDIKGCSMDVEAPEVDIDMKVKGTELEGQGSKFKLPKFGISLPKAKGPAMDITVSKPDVDISLPQVTAEAKLPGVEVEGSSLDGQAKIPDIEAGAGDQGRFKMPHIKFPSFGFSKPEITAPKISGNLNLPSVDIAVTKPDADIKVPDISADVTSVGVKLPEADLAVSGKPPAVDIKGYSMDVETSEVDIDMKVKGTELEGQGSKFKLPKFGISHPKAKGPAMDITVSKPDVDISLPQVTAEAKLPGVEVEGPSVEGTVDIPEVDSKGVDIKLKKPKMSLPKFGFSKPEITAPKISGNLNLPSVDIAVTKPDADINVPDISADVTSVGVKLPEADLAVSGKPPAVDIKGYSMDVETPEVDIDMKVKGTELEGQGSKFKLPKFGISLPKAKGPAMDITVSKPDVDISLPQVTAEAKLPGVEVEGPSVEGTVDIPEVDSKGVDIKLKKPKMSFLKFGFSKQDATAPEIDISLPKGDISLAGGSIEVKEPGMDIKAPDIGEKDSDIKGSPSKFKVPTFKLPKFGITAQKVKAEAPDLSVNITVPDTETPSGKAIIDHEGTVIETGKTEGKFELPKMKIPDIDVKVPTLKGQDMSQEIPKAEYEISGPDTVKVDLKGSSLDGQAEIPDIEAGAGDQGRFKMPHIKFPSFGFSKPEITAPKISGNLNLPSVDIAVTKPDADINVPDISADVTTAGVKLPEADLAVSGKPPAVDMKDYSMDVQAPDVDIGTKGKSIELEGQGSRFKLPKFGITFQKAKGPGVDVSVSKPDVDISLPQVTAEAKLPGVEVEGPSVEGTVDMPALDYKEVDVKLKKPKISLPKFGFSKPDIKAPEIDVSLPKQDICLAEGSMEVKGPEVDIKAADTSAEIKDKNMDIVGSPTKFKVPTIKFPKFGISAPKDTTESPDIKTDIKLPEMEASEKAKVDIGAPSVAIDGSSVELNKPKGQFEPSKIKMPDIDVSLPKGKDYIKTPDIDINLPEVDMSLPECKVDVKGSDAAIKTQDTEANVDAHIGGSPSKFKLPTFKMPKFGMTGSKVKTEIPAVTAESTEPALSGKVNVKHDGQGMDIEKPEGKFELPKVKMEVKVKGPEVNIKAPDTQTEVKDKNMDIIGSPTKFKLPTFKFPTFSAVAPKSKVEAQEVSADLTVPEIKAPLVKAEVDVGAPVLETDVLSIEIEKSEGTGKLPKLKMTSIDMSLPKGQGSESKPEDEMSAVRPEGKTDVSELEATGTTLEAKVDISDPEPPKPEVDIRGSPSKFKLPTFKMPKFGFSTAKVKTKDTDIDTGLKTPEVPSEGATKEIQESIDDGTSNITETDKKTGDAEGQTKSSKFSLSNVFRGFDLEFHVPTLEEVEESLVSPREDVAHSGEIEQSTHTSAEKDSTIKYQRHTDPSQTQLSTSHGAEVSVQAPTITKEAEAKEQSKFKFRFPRLGFTESSEQGDKTESINMNVEEKEKSLEPQEEKEKEDMNEKEANTDKGTWFKFPKFGITSPSKTIKVPEKGTSQPTEGTDKNMEGDIEEGDVSLTSVRSSDAFADISSTVTSEQPGPLVVSPTKVKVKISEPTAMVGVSEVKVPTDIITSTARTELILLEPHLPEQVDTVTIPVSSEATLTSPDEKTQETEGDIHVVTSNIQATPSSEHAKVITKYETHSVQALSLQKMTVKVGSASWTVEGSGEWPGESSEENILVEKHMVKEKSGDDKEAVIITQRVRQIVGASSGEPILEDTASAIKKLRDTMHSEKMKFFEDAETSTVTVSTHEIEKHGFDTSTEKK